MQKEWSLAKTPRRQERQHNPGMRPVSEHMGNTGFPWRAWRLGEIDFLAPVPMLERHD